MKNKLKSNKGAAKRFKKTGSGKWRFGRAKRRHILTKKSTKMKRHARGLGVLKDCDGQLVDKMLPNS